MENLKHLQLLNFCDKAKEFALQLTGEEASDAATILTLAVGELASELDIPYEVINRALLYSYQRSVKDQFKDTTTLN